MFLFGNCRKIWKTQPPGTGELPQFVRTVHTRLSHFYYIMIPEDISLIVELIETVLESKIVGPIRYQADKFNKLA